MLGAILGLCLASTGPAWAEHAASVRIADSDRSLYAVKAYFLHEQGDKISIEEASAASAAARYAILNEETMFDLRPQNQLWVRLDIERKDAKIDHLIAWIPLPLLDSVTLYQMDVSGKWQTSRAGDRIAVASWSEPGRYPRFHFDISAAQTSLYLKVQGSTPVSLPIYIGTELSAQSEERADFLSLGLMIGVLFTLVLMCFVTAYTYKDQLYLLYGSYMLLMILAVGAYTGLSAYLLWDQSPIWADAAQGALAMLTAGGAIYFIEAMLGGRQFARRLSSFLLGLSAIAFPLACLYIYLPRSAGVVLLGSYMLIITAIGLILALRAWRRGDRVGKWIFFAYAPLALAVLLAIARSYGWITISWVVQYGVVAALLIEAPMMMVALNVRSRERHEIRTREQALTNQDALTGLLKEHIFDDRLRQTMARSIKRNEDAAVMLISLVNYEAIAQTYGLPVAEQSVLRAVIKLRRVVRDVETVARVGTSHFGLILEGASHRSSITDIGAKLIAQGLMPLPGLVPDVTLQFHVAAVLMREIPSQQREVKEELMALLANMSRRTRRPIRFWQAPTSADSPLLGEHKPSQATDQLATQAQAETKEPVTESASAQDDSSSPSDWDTSNRDQPSMFV